MARIRSIKPEFFDSPSTAACSPWARLLYIAMWCMADDWGVGPANMKELAAFAFPNDDQWTSKELPSLCKEVADNYGTVFYTHRGRAYYAIPGWDDHQVTQRRAKRRHPEFDDEESMVDLRFHPASGTSEPSQGSSLSPQGEREYGTGEQGNRGTGEQGTSGTAVAAPDNIRPDVEAICNHLADRIEANGSKRPTITKRWIDEARRLIDLDGRTPEQITRAIDWSQQNTFWRTNILSMPKLREKYDQLRLAAEHESSASKPRDRQGDILRAEMERATELDRQNLLEIEGAA